ncbi:hypothetical protein WAF17_01945 [Bernardetia sp. ABR2-2B]|uniref:hypothetical protein n=1 Tax=Bernardetia sp. ABR2-2B TaxID=3127472 RepID=UPI0030CC3668
MKFYFLSFILLFFLTFEVFPQKNFEKGYIIDNSGTKKECLIKNLYSKFDNFEQIKYKLIGSTEVKTGSIKDIQEFGINDTIRYERVIVEIDKSEDGLENKTGISLKLDTLFLNQLVKGKANLYKYVLGTNIRFFFNVGNDTIKQLIYKRYTKDAKEIKDVTYLQQLIKNTNCKGFKFDRIQKVKYTTNSMVTFFEEYNDCENAEYINFYSKVKRRNLINMYIRGGVNISQNNFKRNFKDLDKGTGMGFKLGYEAEVIIPITKKDIFSVFGEVSYYQFKTEVKDNTNSFYSNYTFQHKNLEAAIGLRAYLPLNKNNAFLVDYAIGLNNEIESELVTEFYSELFPFNNTRNLGIGYKYKKIMIQAKYYSKEVQLEFQTERNRQYVSGFMFTVGYHFF